MTDATAMIVDLLGSGHAVQFQARGESMDPLICDGDYLHVEPCERVRVGDIVLVLAARGLTAHRVTANRDGVIVTRGDNAPAADDPVTRDKVLGKVTYILRNGEKKSVSRSAAAVAVSLARRLRRRLRERRPAPRQS